MILTFFCKRNRHTECPGEWPMGDSCGSDHDCSFDVKMSKCECSCHVWTVVIQRLSHKLVFWNLF